LEYIPFGETWTQQEVGTQILPDYQFTGKELDTETGLYYYGARYYDPRISLWESPDPILSAYLDGKPNGGAYDTFNPGLYSYAGLNPVIYVDPDGNVYVRKAVGAGLGFLGNLAGFAASGFMMAAPTGITQVVGIGMGIKFSYGASVNAVNFKRALYEEPEYSKGSLTGDAANIIAPGNKTAQKVAYSLDLGLDLASGKIYKAGAIASLGTKWIPGIPRFEKVFQAGAEESFAGKFGLGLKTAIGAEVAQKGIEGGLPEKYNPFTEPEKTNQAPIGIKGPGN
jgi:RHS repeat-associated protein